MGSLLYGMVWLNFAVFMLAFYHGTYSSPHLHAIGGALVVILAIINRKKLSHIDCPARIKRIAGVMIGMSIAAAVTGALFASPLADGWRGVLQLLHLTVIAALFTQSSSVATAFDMWQDARTRS